MAMGGLYWLWQSPPQQYAYPGRQRPKSNDGAVDRLWTASGAGSIGIAFDGHGFGYLIGEPQALAAANAVASCSAAVAISAAGKGSCAVPVYGSGIDLSVGAAISIHGSCVFIPTATAAGAAEMLMVPVCDAIATRDMRRVVARNNAAAVAAIMRLRKS